MHDVLPFAVVVGTVCGSLWLGLVSNHLAERIGVPAPAFFLVGAAAVSTVAPQLAPDSIEWVQRVVTVALLLILFNGGMDIGMAKFSRNALAITWVGVAGTFVTAAAVAAAAHWLFGMDWTLALLIGAALSPTDPAVVFSVLGRREIAGRSGTILEGESGANDPVGIALMVALLAAGSGELTGVWDQVAAGTVEFCLQMGIGAALGVTGGWVLVRSMQLRPLPSESLYPLRTLVAAGAIYSLATLAHGSGFMAVFVAGIMAGDARAPFKREVERFHSAVASLGEIVAFTVLGLTVDLTTLGEGGAWLEGLVLAVLLAFVIRPLLVGLVLVPVGLSRNERVFVLWAGLKGAVPILLGSYILTSDAGHQVEAYDIVFVVVLFSVLVQGGSVPWVARRLKLPVHVQEPEPWSLGVRFRDEPHGVHRFTVGSGAPADGGLIAELPLGEDVWISLVERDGDLVQVRGATRLQAGDGVVVLAEPAAAGRARRLFVTPSRTGQA
jgi:cell volume regulation protein A